MVRDRLPELLRLCDLAGDRHSFGQRQHSIVNIVEPRPIDVEIANTLDEFAKLRVSIAAIKANVLQMRDILTEITSSLHNSSTLPDQMNSVRESNLATCQRLFDRMKQLEQTMPADGDFSLLARIKRTNFYCIRDDFLAAWREHEAFLVHYEERLTKSLIRQAKITNTDITEEEAECLISNRQTSMFVSNILEETEAARANLREMMTRHSELLKIERSLTEVRDMFVRIAALVVEQNSLIQVIEYHAEQATRNTDRGNNQLEKAQVKKMKWLKRKSCLLIWLSVVLFMFVVILLAVD